MLRRSVGQPMRVRASTLWLVGFAFCVIVPFTTIDARAGRRNLAVVIDGWWSADYAGKACEQAKSFMNDDTMSRIRNFGCGAVDGCPEGMAQLAACTSGHDAKTLAHQFEDRLVRQFASSPACKGAAFARYDGPDAKPPSADDEALMRRPHWELGIDFRPGASTQSWSLQYLGEEHVFQGESTTEARMASEVCAILFGQRSAPGR